MRFISSKMVIRLSLFLTFVFLVSLVIEGFGQGIKIDSSHNITNSAGDDLAPKWSADSKQLLFHSNRNGNWDIFIYSIESDTIARVTSDTTNERNPVWFNNGKSIVFDSDKSGQQKLYKMDLTSGKVGLLFNRAIQGREASFPASEKLVYFSGFNPLNKRWEIYSFEFYYENLNKLTDQGAGNYTPMVSPDEDHVLFTNNTGNYPFHQLQLMNWYGNEEKLFTDFNAFDPSWDSKGLKVYFVSNKDNRSGDIYSMWMDGSHLERLTYSNYQLKNPSVSPDGKHLALSVKMESGFELFIIPMEDY